MRLHLVDEGREALVGRKQRLGEERVDAEGQRGEVECAVGGIGGDPGRSAGAVVERQTLLGLELERGEAEPRQRRVRIQRLALHVDEEGGMEPEHRAGDVGERHQVARCADRAALMDMRMGTGVEERREPFDDLDPDPGHALHQRIGAQQHGGADIGLGETRPGRALVLPQRQPLDVDQLLRPDILIGHGAEQGGDTVDLLSLRYRAPDHLARAMEPVEHSEIVGQLHFRPACHRGDIGQIQVRSADDDGHAHPPLFRCLVPSPAAGLPEPTFALYARVWTRGARRRKLCGIGIGEL